MGATVQQSLNALERANFVRIGSYQVKAELHDGTLTIRQALADPRAGSLKVVALLSAMRRVGPAKASRALHVAGVGKYQKLVRELTPRQIDVISRFFEDADGWNR